MMSESDGTVKGVFRLIVPSGIRLIMSPGFRSESKRILRRLPVPVSLVLLTKTMPDAISTRTLPVKVTLLPDTVMLLLLEGLALLWLGRTLNFASPPGSISDMGNVNGSISKLLAGPSLSVNVMLSGSVGLGPVFLIVTVSQKELRKV